MEMMEASGEKSLTAGSGRFGKIGVLMGGPSAERDISLKSGKAVCESLKQLGAEYSAIDIKTADKDENIRLIKSHRINCAFLALHGFFGEDGKIQEILDGLKIPYTGSGAKASRLAMDKISSHEIFKLHGLNVPKYKIIERGSLKTIDWNEIYREINFPIVVKPATQGSSFGLSIVDNKTGLESGIELAFTLDERLLLEEYIFGREFTVGILDDETLPVIEIVPKKRFFDYEAKYKSGMTDYIVPAKLAQPVYTGLQEKALIAHKVLGCFGCSRVDMILREDDVPFVLEVNTIPGLTETSLLPKAAKATGIDFAELCIKLIELAYEKAEV